MKLISKLLFVLAWLGLSLSVSGQNSCSHVCSIPDGDLPASRTIYVPVAFHIVLPSAELGPVWESRCLALLAKLNAQFNDAGPYVGPSTNYWTQNLIEIYREDVNIQFVIASVPQWGGGGVYQAPLGPNDPQAFIQPGGGQGCSETFDDVKASNNGGSDPIDTERYLNIWVCNLEDCLGNPIGGVANYPWCLNNWPDVNGVVINKESVTGPAPTYAGPTSTPTHEVGHWLGLYHTFGKNQFDLDDCVYDTFIEGLKNDGTALSLGHSCANSDPNPVTAAGNYNYHAMVNNYMSYADNECLGFFTHGQAERMRDAIEEYRPALLNTDDMYEPNESASAVRLTNHPADVAHPSFGKNSSGVVKINANLNWDDGDADFYRVNFNGSTTNGQLVIILQGHNKIDLEVTDISGQQISSSVGNGIETVEYCLDATNSNCLDLIVQVKKDGFILSNKTQPYDLGLYWYPGSGVCSPFSNTSGSGLGSPISLSASSATSCSGNQVTLTATGAASYDWSDDQGGTICTGCSGTQVVTIPNGVSSVTYMVSEAGSYCDQENVTITVSGGPTALAGADQTSPAAGAAMTLNGSATGGTGGYTYQWNWSGGSATTASTSVSPNATTVYTLTATDGNGCTDTDQMYVTVPSAQPTPCPSPNPGDDPSAPVAFTPGTLTSNIAAVHGMWCASETTSPVRPACQANGTDDIWFRGTASQAGTYTVTVSDQVTGTSTNLRMAIYTGANVGGLTLVSCNTTGAGNTSTGTVTVANGDFIWVRVWDNANTPTVVSVKAIITPAAPTLPDLVVTGGMSNPLIPTPGQSMFISTVNAGANADAHFTDVWFAPSTSTIPGSFPLNQSYKVASIQTSALTATGNSTVTFTDADIAAFNLPVGQYVVHMNVDAGNQVNESAENNNWAIIQSGGSAQVMTVTSAGSVNSDLTISSVTTHKTAYAPGEQVEMEITVNHVPPSGLVTLTNVVVHVYYSPNAIGPNTATDLYVTGTNFNTVTNSKSKTIFFNAPSQADLLQYGMVQVGNLSAGRFWCIVDPADAYDESPNEHNNARAVDYQNVATPIAPNYVAETYNVAPANVVDPEDLIFVGWDTKNQGDYDGTSVSNADLFWGDQPTVAATNQFLASSFQIPAVPVNGSQPSTMFISTPCDVVAGQTYYIRIHIDAENDEAESNEADNDAYVPIVIDPSYVEVDPEFVSAPLSTCVGVNETYAVTHYTYANNFAVAWDFGDGTVINNNTNIHTVNYTYSTPGTYTITATVTGGLCNAASSTITQTVTVNPSAAGQVNLTNVSDSELCLGTSLSVAASNVAGIDYLWDWNDGTFATTASATHTYTDPGTYDVSLLVSDNNGCEAATFDTTIVVKVTPRPVPEFTLPLVRCVGLTDTIFTNTPSTTPYIWDDGQGNVTTSNFPGIYPIYSTPGTYTLMLTASDACGVEDTSVLITVVPDIGLSALTIPTTGASSNDGEIDLIVNGGFAPFIYDWSNGETTEDIDNLTNGTYIVSVSDQVGCSSIDSFTVNSTTFPVNWLSITANAINTTDAEIELVGVFDQDNEEVTLEYSRDGIIWNEIEQKTISPDIGIAYPVTFIHYDAAVGTNYAIYRGRGTDQDGNFNYTPKVEVYWKFNEFSLLNIFPNPAHDQINIHYTQEDKRHTVVSVYNMVGQLVAQKSQLSNHSGAESFSIDTQSFPEGIYLIVLSNGKDRHHMKFIVEH